MSGAFTEDPSIPEATPVIYARVPRDVKDAVQLVSQHLGVPMASTVALILRSALGLPGGPAIDLEALRAIVTGGRGQSGGRRETG